MELADVKVFWSLTPKNISTLRAALDRCAGHGAEIDGTATTWTQSRHRLIGLDNNGQIDLTASVDQSDIAE